MPKDDGFCGNPQHAEALRRVLNKGVEPMHPMTNEIFDKVGAPEPMKLSPNICPACGHFRPTGELSLPPSVEPGEWKDIERRFLKARTSNPFIRSIFMTAAHHQLDTEKTLMMLACAISELQDEQFKENFERIMNNPMPTTITNPTQ